METNYYIHYLIMLDMVKFCETNEGFVKAVSKLSSDEITDIINAAILKFPDDKLDIEKNKLSSSFWIYIFSIVFPEHLNNLDTKKDIETKSGVKGNIGIAAVTTNRNVLSRNAKATRDLDNFIMYGEIPED